MTNTEDPTDLRHVRSKTNRKTMTEFATSMKGQIVTIGGQTIIISSLSTFKERNAANLSKTYLTFF